MTQAQIDEFEMQMRELVDIQLAFESLAREFGRRPDPGSRQPAIDSLERYVNELVKEWETRGPDLAAGGHRLDDIASLTSLQTFLHGSRHDSKKTFRTRAAEPLRKLEQILRSELTSAQLDGRRPGPPSA